jgi:heme/copper-type cytochrome/quinol oxidase subunit 2
MNTVFALIAIIGGVLGSLIAFQVVQLDKFISSDEAKVWHEKFGKIFKIIFPIAAVLGLLFLLF